MPEFHKEILLYFFVVDNDYMNELMFGQIESKTIITLVYLLIVPSNLVE